MKTGGGTANLTTIRVISSIWLILVLVPLMMIGCQLGIGVKGGATGLLKKVGLGTQHREWHFQAGDIRYDTPPHVLNYST